MHWRSAYRAMVLALLLILVPFSSSPQGSRPGSSEPEALKSAGDTREVKFGLDGRSWNNLNKFPTFAQVGKLLMVKAIYDGLWFGQSPLTDQYYTNTGIDHLVRALDQFYKDYKNEKILVVHALLVVSMELRGEPEEKIQDTIRKFRSLSSKL